MYQTVQVITAPLYRLSTHIFLLVVCIIRSDRDNCPTLGYFNKTADLGIDLIGYHPGFQPDAIFPVGRIDGFVVVTYDQKYSLSQISLPAANAAGII